MSGDSGWPDPKTEEQRIQEALNQVAHSMLLSSRAEEQLRNALGVLVAAIDPVSDPASAAAGKPHEIAHMLGRLARTKYGCRLEPKPDGSYAHKCSIALGHLAYGWSPAFVYELRCSICGNPAENCEHIEGQSYEGGECRFERIAPLIKLCSICNSQSGLCGHEVGHVYDGKACELYDAPADPLPEHVPLVQHPRLGMRASRPHVLYFTQDQVRAQLGLDWSPDRGVGCDLCLRECAGFVGLEESDTVPQTWLGQYERSKIVGGLHVGLDGIVQEDWWHQVAAGKGWDVQFTWGPGTCGIIGSYSGQDPEPLGGLLEIVDSAFYAVDDLRTVSIAVQLSDGSIRLAEYAREDLPLVKPAEKTKERFNATLPAQADPNMVWLPPH
jgi:hypothetical protein